ncbi:hypothetical protein C2845_PM12G17830 [Panicum miliaceum]|uniref:Thioredoxin family protein n=1 Tax=Panicum miliaceum TaxID=4540 RepID=A0A3L6QI30_PANMI|nr:hypothetical protein C2845_PM12G17830 [Panicum miliaceum]
MLASAALDLQPTLVGRARSIAAAGGAISYHVEHPHSVQGVDDAINREGESGRLVVVRFGRGGDDGCAPLDAALAAAAERIGPVAALYAVDIDEVRGFNVMYELHGPCTLMFFYGYRHVDVRGLRGRDDVDWAAYYSGGGFAGLVQAVHERAKAGRLLVIVD